MPPVVESRLHQRAQSHPHEVLEERHGRVAQTQLGASVARLVGNSGKHRQATGVGGAGVVEVDHHAQVALAVDDVSQDAAEMPCAGGVELAVDRDHNGAEGATDGDTERAERTVAIGLTETAVAVEERTCSGAISSSPNDKPKASDQVAPARTGPSS